MSGSGKRSSPIWAYFAVDEDKKPFANCNLCNLKLSRGSSPKLFSTSPLIQHLRAKHPKEFKEFSDIAKALEQAKKAKQLELSWTSTSSNSTHSSSTSGQLSLSESWDRAKVWDIRSSDAQRFHRAIGRMIVKDMEPYQVVEKQGE